MPVGKEYNTRPGKIKGGFTYDRSLEWRQLITIVTLAALLISIAEVAVYIFFFA